MKYKISDLARILGVTPNTIRRYEKSGYTRPVRDESNYRWYRENDIFTIAIIRIFRRYGFSHGEIEEMLKGDNRETIKIFEKRLKETERELERLNVIKAGLESSLDSMELYEENENKFFISEGLELKYVPFSDGNVFMREPDRLKVMSGFMFETSHVFMIQLWSLEGIRQGSVLPPPNGMAVNRKSFEMLDPEIRKSSYIKSISLGKCLTGVMKKHPKNFDPYDFHGKIALEFFTSALEYMDKNGLVPSGDPIGVVQNSLSPSAGIMVYIPFK